MGDKLHILSARKIDLMSGEGNFSTDPLFGRTARRKDLRHLPFYMCWIFSIPSIAELPCSTVPRTPAAIRPKIKPQNEAAEPKNCIPQIHTHVSSHPRLIFYVLPFQDKYISFFFYPVQINVKFLTNFRIKWTFKNKIKQTSTSQSFSPVFNIKI